MSVDNAAGSGSSEPRRSQRTQALAGALRTLVSQAAERTGGGVALLFVGGGESPAQLRAAAGFATPQAARSAAVALAGAVPRAQTLDAPETIDCPAELAGRADGGLWLHPLVCEGRRHGALVIGAPGPIEPAHSAELAQLGELAALRLDHVRLCEERETQAPRSGSGEGNEELLKLSEALFAQDIELLRKDEKLGKVEKLKNDFIEKMSRELRTPLNSIIETIITVLTGEDAALSESAKGSLRSALDEGTAFLRTLQNILDLWRVKQGELPVEFTEVNFRELVDEAIFSVQDLLDDKPVEVEPQMQEPFPKIRTDLTKVNQVLFLLLDNAVKFTPEGRVEIKAQVEDGVLSCEVSDTGIGICPDDQQFVFDEFYQVDDNAPSRFAGSGLGLTLVRDLVVLLGGDVAMSSDVGVGTSVTFRVPVQVSG